MFISSTWDTFSTSISSMICSTANSSLGAFPFRKEVFHSTLESWERAGQHGNVIELIICHISDLKNYKAWTITPGSKNSVLSSGQMMKKLISCLNFRKRLYNGVLRSPPHPPPHFVDIGLQLDLGFIIEFFSYFPLNIWCLNFDGKICFCTKKFSLYRWKLFRWFLFEKQEYGHILENQGKKGTLLSPTLKVQESNVPSSFWVLAYFLRYGHTNIKMWPYRSQYI